MKNPVYLLLLVVAASCHHDAPVPAHPSISLPPSTNPIVGVWYWTKTIGGWSGLHTPVKEGYNMTLVLNSSFVYTTYKNVTVIGSGQFSIIEKSGLKYITVNNSDEDILLSQPSPDKLIIGGNFADGDVSYYERAK